MNKAIFVNHIYYINRLHKFLIIGSIFDKICSDTFTVTKQVTSGPFPLVFSGCPDTQIFMEPPDSTIRVHGLENSILFPYSI